MTAHPELLLGEEALGDAPARLRDVVEPSDMVDGWATVELDRAEEEVAAGLGAIGPPRIEAAPDERVLGARCRVLQFGGHRVLLLEPSTEGRLASALVRYGEGYVARYLLADAGAPERARRAGLMVARESRGPFGPERLVLAGPRFGPFLLVAGLD